MDTEEAPATHGATTPGLDGDFDKASGRYDLLTRLNPGYHRHLAAAAGHLAERLRATPQPRLMDLGCGSGLSTAALVEAVPSASIVAVDASAGMLEHARDKSWPETVSFVHATAESLPDLDVSPADGILAAYLFRNIPAEGRDQVLGAVRDQLSQGGWLVVQEYSVAGRRIASLVWTLVCWLIVVPLAWIVRGFPHLYVYLWRSVRAFDSTDRFEARLRTAGFTDVRRHDVTGWQRGILHTFVARRPLEH